MPTLPLAGVRVVSLAELYPGPYATLLLAELGADVVQVERPDGGDPARRFPLFHEALNRNKRSVAIDLKHPAGRDAFLRLAAGADVVLEGFRPGTVGRLGIGEPDVRAVNPSVVWVSISGFGQSGELRDRPAHDLSYQALSGLLHDRLEQAAAGPAPRVAVGDLSSGMFAVVSVLSGLLLRARTGEGSTYDLAMTDGLMSWLTADLFAAANGLGLMELPPREPAYGVFRTRDGGLITISITHEDRFWRHLCAATGLDDLAEVDSAERTHRYDELRARLVATFAGRPLAAWEHVLAVADVPHAPVLGAAAVAAGPLVRDRDLLTTVPGDAGRPDRTHVRQPVTAVGAPTVPRTPSPALGAHTREVLGAAGLTDAEIGDLLADGAIGAPR